MVPLNSNILRYHLKNMGNAENDICRYCETAAKTAEHIVCEYKVLIRTRLKYLEQAALMPEDIGKLPPRKITSVVKSL